MAEYEVRAKVDQIVTKEIRLSVVASSEEEATEKAREALQVYPAPHEVVGIRRIQTEKATYWIPRDIEFVETVRIGK
jgi:hypothetical protein